METGHPSTRVVETRLKSEVHAPSWITQSLRQPSINQSINQSYYINVPVSTIKSPESEARLRYNLASVAHVVAQSSWRPAMDISNTTTDFNVVLISSSDYCWCFFFDDKTVMHFQFYLFFFFCITLSILMLRLNNIANILFCKLN